MDLPADSIGLPTLSRIAEGCPRVVRLESLARFPARPISVVCYSFFRNNDWLLPAYSLANLDTEDPWLRDSPPMATEALGGESDGIV